jgi:hypothetical protein
MPGMPSQLLLRIVTATKGGSADPPEPCAAPGTSATFWPTTPRQRGPSGTCFSDGFRICPPLTLASPRAAGRGGWGEPGGAFWATGELVDRRAQ